MLDRRLMLLIGKDKKYIFEITLLNLLSTIISTAITGLFCYSLFLVSLGKYGNIIYTACAIVLLAAIRILIASCVSVRKNHVSNIVKEDLRGKVYDKLLKLGLTSDRMSLSSFTQLAIDGIEQLDGYYSVFIPSFFYAITSTVILFTVACIIEWTTALILLICIPIIPIVIIAISKYAKKIFNKYWERYLTVGDGFNDFLSGMKELKIFEYDDEAAKKIARNSEEFRKVTMKVLVMQLMSITVMDIGAFGGAGVAIVMTLIKAVDNPDKAYLFLFLILMSAEFFLPMRALGSAFHMAMNGVTAGRNMIDFLGVDETKWGDKVVDDINIVELCNVSFSYNGERQVLDNVNMKFSRGFNAIAGASGSGKSTIISLIKGTNVVNSGSVNINGNNISDLSREAYYSHICVISATSRLFKGTVRDNFRRVNPDITDTEITMKLREVNLYDDIMSKNGLDTVIEEDAKNISGGQKQRLVLAVSTVNNKDLYIFDEATGNIDAESEEIIMKRIRDISRHAIVIVISHRLYNIKDSDHIYFIECGKVTGEGSHDELVGNSIRYRTMYEEQLS